MSSSCGLDDISSLPDQPPKKSTATHHDFLDEQFLLHLLHHGSPSDQESALVFIRHATRSNNPDLRIAMCTPTLLSWLCPMILSPNLSLRTNAIAVVVNLSLEPPNRTRIVKSGILNLLIGLFKNKASNTDAKGLVMAAIHSLSVEEKNRTTIGALGAVQPLMEVFTKGDEEKMSRQDAGMAIYYLTFSSDNRGRIVKTHGAVRRIVGVLKGDQDEDIKSVGMRIACNLARCEDGRSALMEADGVAVMVGLVEPRSVPEQRICREDMAYMAAAAMYGMSKGKSLRFRCMAKSANAEEVLGRVSEEGSGAIKEMARRTLQVLQEEGEEDERDEWYKYTGSRGAGGLAMSEPMKRRQGSYSGNFAVSEPDWMQ